LSSLLLGAQVMISSMLRIISAASVVDKQYSRLDFECVTNPPFNHVSDLPEVHIGQCINKTVDAMSYYPVHLFFHSLLLGSFNLKATLDIESTRTLVHLPYSSLY
jgi:hypothetical protein